MNARFVLKGALAALVFAACLAGAGQALCGEAPAGDALYAGADARIEKHRKAPAVVSVVDAAGKPVAGAEVAVEQVRHAFLFGCNIFMWGKCGNDSLETGYRQRFSELLNYATLPFYWPSYERRKGEPIHERTEQVARWCKEQGIATKGHPLAWNFAEPSWLPDDLEEIRRLQMARIDDCVSRFAGLIDRWDVVNEVTAYDRQEFLTKAPKFSAMWKKAGQIEFTRECFTHARKAGPKATLLINDYRVDPPYEKVIEQLVDAGGRRQYDVIGIQSHMHGGTWPNARIWEVCERFSRFGVPLHFTETTIVSGPRPKQGGGWVTTPEGEAAQAREVVRFYTMLFSHPAVEGLTWWDFSDLGAWQSAPAGFLRKDMTPKPAYDELLKLVKGKWWTRASLRTDADGRAGFSGFLGAYQVTVTAGGKRCVVKDLVLAKGAGNNWVVRVE